MKIKLSKTKFYSALNVVTRAISSSSPVAPLHGVYIEAVNDTLVLKGSNGDISIQIVLSNDKDDKLNLVITEEGKIVVDAEYVTAIASKIDSDELSIDTDEGTLTKFYSAKTKYKINGYRPTDYPEIDFSTPETTFTLKTDDLNGVIDAVVFATSRKETRPVLTGVNLRGTGTSIIATATDSYRLAKKTFDLATAEFNINVPAKTLNEAQKVFGNKVDNITVALNEKKIQFTSDTIILQSRLLEGKYPETERLIPQEFSHTLVIDRADLISAIDRNLFIKEDSTTINTMQMKDTDNINLISRSKEIGESNGELKAISFEGDPLTLSFAANYVLEAAKALTSVNVKICFNGAMKPFVMTNANGDDSVLQLVLPVKTYNN